MFERPGIPTTADRVELYETTAPLLSAMQDELRELAKKKPEATLSKGKITLINRLLTDIRFVLRDEPNVKYLDLLEDDALPQFSDVVLIVSQYSAALDAFRERHRQRDSMGNATWILIEQQGAPRKRGKS